MIRFKKISALAMTLSLLSTAAAAQEEQAASKATQELQTLENSLQDSNAKQAVLNAEIGSLAKAQAALNEKLIAVSDLLSSKKIKLSEDQAKIKELQKKQVALHGLLNQRADETALLLQGLQKLSGNPPPAVIVDPKRVLESMRGAMLLQDMVPELRIEADRLKEQLSELVLLQEELIKGRKAEKQGLAELEEQAAALKDLLQQKKQLAAGSEAELQAEKDRANLLAARAKDLRDLMAQIEDSKQGLATGDSAVSAEVEAKAQRLAELANLRSLAYSKPPLPMREAEGQIALPVKGKIMRRFGEEIALGKNLEGVVIGTLGGMIVTAPVDGKVVFAGEFKSYGQIVIIDGGDGYLMLVAGMREITTELGQELRAGEPIGFMGESTSSLFLQGLGQSLEQDAEEKDGLSAKLYVEIRKDNKPLNPKSWWRNEG